MADFGYNKSKGKVAEYAARVNANDPANSALIVMAINANGVTDATLKDLDDFAAILGTAADEVTNGGYARKTITDAGGITITVDDTNDLVLVDMPDQTWVTVLAGDSWTDLVIGYDSDTTGGTDANIVPLVQLDFITVPSGANVVWTLNSGGFWGAT